MLDLGIDGPPKNNAVGHCPVGRTTPLSLAVLVAPQLRAQISRPPTAPLNDRTPYTIAGYSTPHWDAWQIQ
ncbi:hypothetical protein TNCV_1414021 [Trichonephila clavipes]|nr:hypothetical protein TNCV_1414021 [Trichonephila clavipes]